ncbi:MAG: sigma-70 family RNA polymerase sigma factor [Verrucomicrobiota bacterium]
MPDSPDARFITAFTEAQSSLKGFCVSSIGNFEDAKDVFQKTCLVLWKKSGEWDPETPFLRWAFAVARFEVLSHIRDSSRDRLVFDEDVVRAMTGTTERIAESQPERTDALEGCLNELKPEHRSLLSQYYVHGFTMKEISEAQNRGLSAIKVMIMRLRNTLAECVENRLKSSS